MDTRTDGHTDDRSPERRALDDAQRTVDRTFTEWDAAIAAVTRALLARDDAKHAWFAAAAQRDAAARALRDA